MSIVSQMQAQVNSGATVAQAVNKVVPGASTVFWQHRLVVSGPTCPVCGSRDIWREDGINLCRDCGARWVSTEMSAAKTEARQAAWEAAHPADDYGLGL